MLDAQVEPLEEHLLPIFVLEVDVSELDVSAEFLLETFRLAIILDLEFILGVQDLDEVLAGILGHTDISCKMLVVSSTHRGKYDGKDGREHVEYGQSLCLVEHCTNYTFLTCIVYHKTRQHR